MKNRSFSPMVLLFCSIVFFGAGEATAQNAPYVGAWEADNLFGDITSDEMDVLRTKKILFASRSFGLNMRNGLDSLKNSNLMYNILDDYVRYDVRRAGGDLGIIPTDVYDDHTFVHFLASYTPHTLRIEELDALIREEPHTFHDDIDVAMIFYHYADSTVFMPYTSTMDQLQADYPHIKFIYVTAGFMDINHVYENTLSAAFSEQMRTAYQGNVPLYDLGYILNNDGACGLGYCPEYSTDPAGVHPDTDFAQRRMGKAFLLILRDSFFGWGCTNSTPPSVPTGLSGAGISDTSISLTWNASTHPDADCASIRYELTRDGSLVVSTYHANFIDTGLAETNSYDYAVRSLSLAGVSSAYSPVTAVSTLFDSTPPALVGAEALSSTRVGVEFSEALDPISAEAASNYALNNGVSVFSATLSDNTVTLLTSGMINGANYTLTVNNVTDASSAANPIVPDSQTTFTYEGSYYPSDSDAYWAFNGDLSDSTANTNHGTWVAGASFGTGLLGEGLEVNGTADGTVMVPHDSVLDGMNHLSISVWAKKDNPDVGGYLFKKHVVYDMRISSDTVTTALFAEDGSVDGHRALFTASAPINDTNWHHYALVYDGSFIHCYVDGTKQGSYVQPGGAVKSRPLDLFVGADPWGTGVFSGEMDEMKLFRYALSDDEIGALVAAGTAGAGDRAAVRALLDANGVTSTPVDSVSVYENDRIDRLYIQEGGISNITSLVGQLSELTLLHCYGDRTLGFPLLATVAPEIGNCVKLEELLLNQNDLVDLPGSIVNLTGLGTCSIGDNKLCDPAPVWESWADTYDPDWRDTQDCSASGGAAVIVR